MNDMFLMAVLNSGNNLKHTQKNVYVTITQNKRALKREKLLE